MLAARLLLSGAPAATHGVDKGVDVVLIDIAVLVEVGVDAGGVLAAAHDVDEDALPMDGTRLAVWNNLDVEKMSVQFPYPILAVFIQPNVAANDDIPPVPYQPVIELTEGPHFGYALQWFTFAAILFLGYPFYLKKQDD